MKNFDKNGKPNVPLDQKYPNRTLSLTPDDRISVRQPQKNRNTYYTGIVDIVICG